MDVAARVQQQAAVAHDAQHRRLGAEQVVDRGRADAGLVGDHFHRQVRYAHLAQQGGGRLHDTRASAALGALAAGRGGDVVNHLQGEYVSVYVPTTPNPTSGFFLMMPQKDVIVLDMSVDEALKYIISMGVVAPATGRAVPKAGAAQKQAVNQ